VVEKSLDIKIKRILTDSLCEDFILADAKDADMAFGMAAPGQSPEYHGQEGRYRSLDEYRDLIRQNIAQGLVDIMLMSASTNELLTIEQGLFEESPITPAARANDTTDIHVAMGGRYREEPSRPFRTATIDHIMCGKVACEPSERSRGADLGLYSVTFNNDLERDLASLEAYRAFRIEAEQKGFRHFLEVFDPNACGDHCPEDMGRFLNDQIARTLAGVCGKGRPVFLKIPYHGPAAMEQLASYDSSIVPGILGGSSGTTFDAFYQLWEAKKYGARAALYGRMINHSEHQLTFIQHLRWLADGVMTDPAEAVRSYHGALQKLSIKPYRDLNDDLQATLRATAYGGKTGKPRPTTSAAPPTQSSRSSDQGEADFASMTAAEKLAWNRSRWDRILG